MSSSQFLFLLVIILFPYVFEKMLHPDKPREKQLRYGLAVIVYAQIAVFVCLILMERYLHVRHRESLRQGYLEFYRDTQRIKRIPAYTFALGKQWQSLLAVLASFDEQADVTRLALRKMESVTSVTKFRLYFE